MSSNQPEGAADAERLPRRRRMQRVQAAMAVLVASMGLISFSGVAGNPRFETYHTLDVFRLMASGASFGIAFVLLIQFFVFRDRR